MNNESQLLTKEAPINSILRLVMNDQNSKNALSNKMISALMDAIAFANNDNSIKVIVIASKGNIYSCLLYTSPSPRDGLLSRMPSSA